MCVVCTCMGEEGVTLLQGEPQRLHAGVEAGACKLAWLLGQSACRSVPIRLVCSRDGEEE